MDLEKELRALHEESFQWALHCTEGRRSDAEDALQASYEALLDGSARFEGRSTLKSFLFGVIRNKARSLKRKRGFFRLISFDSLPEEGAAPKVERKIARSEEAAQIREAIEACSPRQQAVLELVFYHDLTLEEAAKVLGLGVGTVRTHYARAKDTLRQRLAQGEKEWTATIRS